MTNTYPDNATWETKVLEEIRCLRCVNERILRVMDEGLFTDYQLEKFSGNAEARNLAGRNTKQHLKNPKEDEVRCKRCGRFSEECECE
jgi:hypothetical protein